MGYVLFYAPSITLIAASLAIAYLRRPPDAWGAVLPLLGVFSLLVLATSVTDACPKAGGDCDPESLELALTAWLLSAILAVVAVGLFLMLILRHRRRKASQPGLRE